MPNRLPLHRSQGRALFSVALSLLIHSLAGGCSGDSRPYQPLPLWEQKFFSQAQREVFPFDVREAPAKFNRTLVAWTGIVKAINFETEAEAQVARFVVEHRYFNWKEYRADGRMQLALSSRGEGMFTAAWRVERPDDAAFVRKFAVGDMIVAYGYPTMVRGGAIGLYPVQNIRPIKPEWFRADLVDYGRPASAPSGASAGQALGAPLTPRANGD